MSETSRPPEKPVPPDIVVFREGTDPTNCGRPTSLVATIGWLLLLALCIISGIAPYIFAMVTR